jgi:hypothetical protein
MKTEIAFLQLVVRLQSGARVSVLLGSVRSRRVLVTRSTAIIDATSLNMSAQALREANELILDESHLCK